MGLILLVGLSTQVGLLTVVLYSNKIGVLLIHITVQVFSLLAKHYSTKVKYLGGSHYHASIYVCIQKESRKYCQYIERPENSIVSNGLLARNYNIRHQY
jgi:hypothetical protein